MNWNSWILSYMIDSFSGLLRVLVTYYLAWLEFSAKLFFFILFYFFIIFILLQVKQTQKRKKN